jgi:hypothetical protein
MIRAGNYGCGKGGSIAPDKEKKKQKARRVKQGLKRTRYEEGECLASSMQLLGAATKLETLAF